jgi:hypothetical protein
MHELRGGTIVLQGAPAPLPFFGKVRELIARKRPVASGRLGRKSLFLRGRRFIIDILGRASYSRELHLPPQSLRDHLFWESRLLSAGK